MNTTAHRAFLSGASLASAQGFAIAFAAMGMVLRVVTLNVEDANLSLAIGTLLYGAAGALGAAYLASTMNWRSVALLFTLGGILGAGGGFMLTTLGLTARIHPDLAFRTTVEAVYITQHAIIGGLIGLFLGIAAWSPRRLLLLVVLGAAGFGLGYLMQTSLNDLLAEPLADLVGSVTDSEAVNIIAASLLWGVGSALCGLLGGGAIGYAFEL